MNTNLILIIVVAFCFLIYTYLLFDMFKGYNKLEYISMFKETVTGIVLSVLIFPLLAIYHMFDKTDYDAIMRGDKD